MSTDGNRQVRVQGAADVACRTWRVRVHLAVGRCPVGATLDGANEVPIKHLGAHAEDCAGHFPFGGVGAAPACGAGLIAGLEVQAFLLGWDLEMSTVRSGLSAKMLVAFVPCTFLRVASA